MSSLIPDAATYGTEQAQATQAYQKAKSNIQTGQLGWLQQYGMTAQYNPDSGAYSNYTVDPTNQYGLIQQNRTSEAQDLSSAQDDSISRGLGGGAGLGQQKASAFRYQHGVQDQNLGNTFMQGMGQYGSQLSDAANTYQQSLYQAEADAIQKALANQQYEQYYDGGDQGNNDTDQLSNPSMISPQGLADLQTWKPPTAAQLGLAATKQAVVKNLITENSSSQNKVNAANKKKGK